MLFCFFFFFLFCVFLSRPFVLLCSSADELRPRARKLYTDRREEEYKKQAFYVLYVFLTVFDELWSRDEFPLLLLLDMFRILRGCQLEHTSIGPWRMLYCIIQTLSSIADSNCWNWVRLVHSLANGSQQQNPTLSISFFLVLLLHKRKESPAG